MSVLTPSFEKFPLFDAESTPTTMEEKIRGTINIFKSFKKIFPRKFPTDEWEGNKIPKIIPKMTAIIIWM